ncbi:MAG: hypothetical protein KC649_07685, partial [Candidatus Omnitrophica bacterium]|nr:hypothetical protein [Candidatus Omnitrophota bacterium]
RTIADVNSVSTPSIQSLFDVLSGMGSVYSASSTESASSIAAQSEIPEENPVSPGNQTEKKLFKGAASVNSDSAASTDST